MERWRLLDIEFKNPCMNLAVEEAVARTIGSDISPPTVRFWRNINAVVIGRFQKVDHEVDLDECKRNGISVVRRFTGGGAVYHDNGNLNCAISLPCKHPLIEKAVPTLYRILGTSLIEGLNSLGLESYMNSNSIYIDGKKISGMAGAINWGASFHHCTFLVSTNIDIMRKVLKPANCNASKKYVQSKREEVTTLEDQLSRTVSISEAKALLTKALEVVWGIKLVEGDLTSEEKSLAQELCEEKYLTSGNAILLEVGM